MDCYPLPLQAAKSSTPPRHAGIPAGYSATKAPNHSQTEPIATAPRGYKRVEGRRRGAFCAEPAPPRADRACLALSSSHPPSLSVVVAPLLPSSPLPHPTPLHSPPRAPCFHSHSPGRRGSGSAQMAVDPRQVVAGFLTFSMFIMLGNMIKHDHFSSPGTQVRSFLPPRISASPLSIFPLIGGSGLRW